MGESLNNWVFTWEEIQQTPSRKDGVTWEAEKGIRHNSCIFILEMGKYLRRGKTDNTAYIRDSAACVLFHRFFMAQSFKSHNRLIIGAACLFLAGKIEGCSRSLSEIVRKYCQVRGMAPEESVIKEQQEMILFAERVILHTLCFDMHIEHHFKPLASKLQTDLKMYIPEDARVAVMNSAFCFIRDSFGTVLCLLYPAHLRAAGALFLAILQYGISPQLQQRHRAQAQQLPNRLSNGSEELGKSWFSFFEKDIKESDLKDICYQIIDVYESKNWKPKSDAKSAPDIDKLKNHLTSFFDKDTKCGQSMLTKNENDVNRQNNSIRDQITQPPPQNVKKIETPVEKNRKNSPHYDMNSFSSSISLFRGSDDSNDVASRARLAPQQFGALSSNDVRALVPPPTPDYIPPPPAPALTSKSLVPAAPTHPPPTPEFIAPPPTPEYLPPPTAPAPTSFQPTPQPTPEHVPPPLSPQRQQQTTSGCMSVAGGGMVREGVQVTSVQAKTSPMISSKRLQGHSNGYEYNDNSHSNGFGTSGMTSNGSSGSLSSPPNYCSPPQSDGMSSKRPRLEYNCEVDHLVR